MPPTADPRKEQLALYYARAYAESRRSLKAYLRHVVANTSPEPRRWGDVAEPWQWDLLEPLVRPVERLAGVAAGRYDGPRYFWRTLPKGHDKTGGEARLLNWLMVFARRPVPLQLYAVAADADQAGLILQTMQEEAALTRWLNPPATKRVVFHRRGARSRHADLTVLAADAATNQGLRPDLVVADELTCWKSPTLWTSMASGMEKRPGAVMVVTTNAGVRGSWQEGVLAAARASPRWHVYESPEGRQLASWMDPAGIADLRKTLPPAEAARLFDNRWVDPGEESGYLTRAEAEACAALGAEMGLVYRDRGERGVRYFAAVDYGPTRDRTALVVLHRDRASGVVCVDHATVLQGCRDRGDVLLADVEAWMRRVRRDFNDPLFVVDPYEMRYVMERLRGTCRMETFRPRAAPSGNHAMAENLRTLAVGRKLAWYPGCADVPAAGGAGRDTLADELAALIVRRTPGGYRFDHLAGRHDDRAVAVGMAALYCVQSQDADFVQPDVPDPPPEPKPADPLLGPRRGHAARRGLFGLSA